jgi:hypothetical protein
LWSIELDPKNTYQVQISDHQAEIKLVVDDAQNLTIDDFATVTVGLKTTLDY